MSLLNKLLSFSDKFSAAAQSMLATANSGPMPRALQVYRCPGSPMTRELPEPTSC
jgi:hypothetical protein